MNELWTMSAVELASGIAGRHFSPTEVVESVLERIDATNPDLNAITVLVHDSARVAAAAADAAVIANDELGPLHGVPVTIKENVDVEGQPTPNGLPALADLVATEDAPLVRNLRRAGAIIVGRTNTPEFSMRATTDNPLRGRTYNPWGAEISPGGSSGGAGSACAAGMGPLHHGNDIGGSLRFPAFANGVTTVKPTSFRVPVFNSTAPGERGPLAQAMSVQGVIARHAADVRLALPAMIESDPRDPNAPPVPFEGPTTAAPIRVALTTESHGYDLRPEIAELIELAGEQLADAGYAVERVDPPPIIEPAREWFRAGTTEFSTMFDRAISAYGSPTIRDIFDWYYALGENLSRDDYMTALGDRTRLMRQWSIFQSEFPLVLTPFLMRPMYDWDYDTRGADAVRDLFHAAIYSTGVNYLGVPAGVIGTGLVDGRPAAVQLIGPRWREDLICDALEAIEARNGVLTRRLWATSDPSD